MNTWFFCRSSFPEIIYLSMLMMTIILLFWYSLIQRVQIHQSLIFQIRRWLIQWEIIFRRQWNKKMVRCLMNLILAVGRSMQYMMTLNPCLMHLKKILDINYTYGYLTQTMTQDILWRVKIFFIFLRMDERGGVFRAKWIWTKEKKPAKEIRVYILVSHVINGEKLLHELGGFDVSYHSNTTFEQLED